MSQHLEMFTGEAPFAREYRILRQISSGGMGAVYLAEQISTGKARALKLMHPELLTDDKLRERFEQEARVSSLIQSDHVVEVIDAGIEPSSSIPWIAMELLVGCDMDTYMAKFGPVQPPAMIEILRQVCHALGAAHGVGVVHRDLKPENIFLTASKSAANEPTSIKVLDFGIAKVLAQVHRSTTALGTPLWMAPEQSDPRAAITAATDVWALGLFAFWVLTGKSFWMAMQSAPVSVQALMREVLFDPIPSLPERAEELEVADKIPEGFTAWFERCVVRDPALRFPEAHTAHAALVAALGPELDRQSALPTLTAEQAGEPGQMNPRGLGLARLPVIGRSEPQEARTAPAKRPPWIAITVGTLVGLLLGGGAIAFALGYIRFGPPAPVAEVPTASATSTTTQTTGPIVSAVVIEPIASVQSSAVSSIVLSSKPTASHTVRKSSEPAPRALVAFDAGAAIEVLQQKANNARNACADRPGPRGFSAKVSFNQRGAVQMVSIDPMISSQLTVLCAGSFLWGALTKPFDTPDLGSVSISVLLD